MEVRYFEYQDEKSDKFWEISLSASSFTTRWGRRGTNGQQKEKSFDSEALAKKEYEKLVSEKLKEGYVEKKVDTPDSGVQSKQGQTLKGNTTSAMQTTVPLKESAEKSVSEKKKESAQPVANGLLDTEVKKIDLDPLDWHKATWRNLPSLAKPTRKEKPFNLEALCSAVEKLKGQYWRVDYSKFLNSPDISLDEAHFWFFMIIHANRENTPDKLAKLARKEDYNGKFDLSDMSAIIKARKSGEYFSYPPELFFILLRALTFEQLLNELFYVDPKSKGYGRSLGIQVYLELFARYVWPYLSEAEKNLARDKLRPLLVANPWPVGDYYVYTTIYAVAALFGMHNEIYPVICDLADDTYARESWMDHYHQPQRIIFGFNDPNLVIAQMKRLKLKLNQPEYIRAWLAHTEYSELDYAADSVIDCTNKDEAEALAKAFALVDAPEATVGMIRILLKSKAPRVAKEWLSIKPARSIASLVSLAAGSGAVADASIDLLCIFLAQGYKDVIEKYLESLPSEAQKKIRENVLENPCLNAQELEDGELPELLSELLNPPKAKLPAWLIIAELPAILLGSKRLSQNQIAALLAHLCNADLPNPPRLATELKKLADGRSLDRFAWRLFELWLAVGAPSKDKWCFLCIGALGGDSCALKLAPLIKVWPGEAQHQRAVAGLEVLRCIGTDTALMQLNGIANKVSFKALKQRANECMEAIAKSMGLSKAELEDRVVPDCGLDERGRRTFDFGNRSFDFILGPDMKPMIRGADLKLKSDLPAPNSKDDPEKSAKAVEEWKLLKKQIREVAKIQAIRLEQAMVVGRSWNIEDFELLVAKHPLMTHLARLFVWACTDKNGKITKLFRVTDEQDYANEKDESVSISDEQRVFLVHPLYLTKEQLSAWGQVFSDYELIPPFPQLGRSVFKLDEVELSGNEIERLKKLKFPAPTLVFTLEKLGWTRGLAEDAGCFFEHSRQFQQAKVTAVITYEGNVGMGYIDAAELLENCTVHFAEGLRAPSGYDDYKNKLPLKNVDPVVLSEVLYDLTVLESKLKGEK